MRVIALVILLAGLVSGQTLPDAPHPKPKTSYLVLLGIDAAATLADARITSQAQVNGCNELDVMYGKHPSNARIYGTMFGIMAGEQFVTHILRAKHKRVWMLPALLNVGTHVQGALYSRGCL
jgi:hypothetical protein